MLQILKQHIAKTIAALTILTQSAYIIEDQVNFVADITLGHEINEEEEAEATSLIHEIYTKLEVIEEECNL